MAAPLRCGGGARRRGCSSRGPRALRAPRCGWQRGGARPPGGGRRLPPSPPKTAPASARLQWTPPLSCGHGKRGGDGAGGGGSSRRANAPSRNAATAISPPRAKGGGRRLPSQWGRGDSCGCVPHQRSGWNSVEHYGGGPTQVGLTQRRAGGQRPWPSRPRIKRWQRGNSESDVAVCIVRNFIPPPSLPTLGS